MKPLWKLLLSLLPALTALGTREDVACPAKFSFTAEDQTVLRMMGFKESCTLSALRGCELGCHDDFVQEALATKKALSEAFQYTTKALDQIRSFTGCLKANGVLGSGNYSKDCSQIKELGQGKTGTATIYPKGCCLHPHTIHVWCDQEYSEGGWTLIQSRNALNPPYSFNKSWAEYVKGFGDPTQDFWIGLENIHLLTSLGKTELRVSIEATNDIFGTVYDDFKLGDASTQFEVLSLGKQTGGDGVLDDFVGRKFSTYDSEVPGKDCLGSLASGWWRRNCNDVSLNYDSRLALRYRVRSLERVRLFVRRAGVLISG